MCVKFNSILRVINSTHYYSLVTYLHSGADPLTDNVQERRRREGGTLPPLQHIYYFHPAYHHCCAWYASLTSFLTMFTSVCRSGDRFFLSDPRLFVLNVSEQLLHLQRVQQSLFAHGHGFLQQGVALTQSLLYTITNQFNKQDQCYSICLWCFNCC